MNEAKCLLSEYHGNKMRAGIALKYHSNFKYKLPDEFGGRNLYGYVR
jgi:hypothetical protein